MNKFIIFCLVCKIIFYIVLRLCFVTEYCHLLYQTIISCYPINIIIPYFRSWARRFRFHFYLWDFLRRPWPSSCWPPLCLWVAQLWSFLAQGGVLAYSPGIYEKKNIFLKNLHSKVTFFCFGVSSTIFCNNHCTVIFNILIIINYLFSWYHINN